MQFSSLIAPAKRNKVMTPEQFNQVVLAITEGRYSWACVLILRFAGYNPVHFIPYRTYSRLVKENTVPVQVCSSASASGDRSSNVSIAAAGPAQSFVKVNDLSHLETLQSGSAVEGNSLSKAEIQGGCFRFWLADSVEKLHLPQWTDQSCAKMSASNDWN